MTAKESGKSKGIGAAGQQVAPRLVRASVLPRGFWTPLLILGLAVLPVMSAKAQETQQSDQALTRTQASDPAQAPAESKNKTTGNYTVQQTIEFGYRDSLINGNIDNYDTFENLGSGLRLFNYTVDMHSINHQGPFFDNLTFSNFGYGGDPNDVSRLRVNKDKWYDFRALYRRDKNFWNYDLLANPLNPTTGPIPNGADRQFPARDGLVPPDAGLRSRLCCRNRGSGSDWVIRTMPIPAPLPPPSREGPSRFSRRP